jgi:hypothetical protein
MVGEDWLSRRIIRVLVVVEVVVVREATVKTAARVLKVSSVLTCIRVSRRMLEIQYYVRCCAHGL